MEETNQALFFAIAKDDYATAKKLLEGNANPNALYEIQKGKFISAANLFVTKCALVAAKKGQNNSQYKAQIAIAKDIAASASLQCKCLKGQHKCPLFLALQIFKITDERQIIEGKCQLLRFLIINGATLKYEPIQKKTNKTLGQWELKWFDFEGIRAYLVTKNFKYVKTEI